MSQPGKRRLHYGWIAAAVTFATLLAAAGARATPGVIIVPICNEFQWSRATVSSIVSVNIFLYGLVGPFAAALYDWFGLRKTMAAALALIAAGFGASSFVHSYWQFLLLWGVVVGLGSGMAATVLGAAVASRWFATQRGLVMGILTASTATGQLVFLPALAAVTVAHGWRAAPFTVAGVSLAVVPIVWLFMKDHPRDAGLRAYGEAGEPEPAPPVRVNPARQALAVLAEAVRVRDFWLLAGSFFICGASTNGLIGTHLIPAAYDCGIPEIRAAGLLAMMGIFDLAGTTLSGWLSDRCNSRRLLCAYYGFRGLSLLFLPMALARPSSGLTLFAVFYGLDWIATVPPTVKLAGDVFGRARAGIVFGWVVAAHQLGAAFAAYAAGWIRTAMGDYTPAFIAAGLLCLVASVGVLPIGGARPKGVLTPAASW